VFSWFFPGLSFQTCNVITKSLVRGIDKLRVECRLIDAALIASAQHNGSALRIDANANLQTPPAP
jgi:hypothetical protein